MEGERKREREERERAQDQGKYGNISCHQENGNLWTTSLLSCDRRMTIM